MDRAKKYFEKIARRGGYMYSSNKTPNVFTTEPLGKGGIFSLLEVNENILLCYESPTKSRATRVEIIVPDDFE